MLQVQAAAVARKAELHYERRVAAVEREGEEKMLLMCRAAAGVDNGQVDAAAAASHEECLRLLRLRGEELRLVRKQVEVLEHEVQQAAAAAAAAPTLVEVITQIDLPVTRQLAASSSSSSSSSSSAVTKVPALPAKARSVFERLADESNFTGATREKILMKRVRIKFIGRWMSRWRQALPALRAERVISLAASKVRAVAHPHGIGVGSGCVLLTCWAGKQAGTDHHRLQSCCQHAAGAAGAGTAVVAERQESRRGCSLCTTGSKSVFASTAASAASCSCRASSSSSSCCRAGA